MGSPSAKGRVPCGSTRARCTCEKEYKVGKYRVQGSSGVYVLGAGIEVTMGTLGSGDVGQGEKMVTFLDSLTQDQGLRVRCGVATEEG